MSLVDAINAADGLRIRAPSCARPGSSIRPPSPDLLGGEVSVKLENLQHTGSFKLRGATNKILSLWCRLDADHGDHGVIWQSWRCGCIRPARRWRAGLDLRAEGASAAKIANIQ